VSTVEQTDSQATREVMQRFYTAIMSWDVAAIKEVVAEDAELHQPPTLHYGGIYRGREAMMKLWQDTVLPLADGTTAYIDSMVIDGNQAVCIAGAEMDGKPTLACEDYLVENGQIRRIRMFWQDYRPVAEAADRRKAAAAG
jgi:ketosteroid isomerase-like protein